MPKGTKRLDELTPAERDEMLARVSLAIDIEKPPHSFYALALFGSDPSAARCYVSDCDKRVMARALFRLGEFVAAESLGECTCWLSLNTGPNGECESCGKIRRVH